MFFCVYVCAVVIPIHVHMSLHECRHTCTWVHLRLWCAHWETSSWPQAFSTLFFESGSLTWTQSLTVPASLAGQLAAESLCLSHASSGIIGRLPFPLSISAVLGIWALVYIQEASHPRSHCPNPRHKIFKKKKFNCKIKIYYSNCIEKGIIANFTFIKESELLKNKANFKLSPSLHNSLIAFLVLFFFCAIWLCSLWFPQKKKKEKKTCFPNAVFPRNNF